MRLGLRFIVLLVLLAFALPSSDARADERVSLEWSAPPECPSSNDVLAEIDHLLGPRSAADLARVDVDAKVSRVGDGYRVRLEIPGNDGPREREMSATSCVALGKTVALIIAMMIDPEAALSAVPRQTNPGQTKQPDVEPGQYIAPLPAPLVPAPSPIATFTPAVPRVVTSPIAQQKTILAAGANAVIDIGSLPTASIGFGAAFSIMFPRVRLQAGASYFISRTTSFAIVPSASSEVDFFAAHASVMARFKPSRNIELSPALQFDLGRMHGRSFGVSDPGEGAAIFAGLGVGGRVFVRLAQGVYSVTSLDAIVALTRPRFVVIGIGDAHRPSPVVMRLATGLEWRF